MTDLSDQLEQQRIDFQFRQTRLEDYVRRHESGDRITWARLLSEKALSGTDTFRTSKTPRVPVQRVFQPQSEPAKRAWHMLAFRSLLIHAAQGSSRCQR